MVAVIGAAGNVGFSTSAALRQAGVPVKAILRDVRKAVRLTELGCEVAVADLQNVGELSQAISNVDAVQVILPLSPQAPDPAADLRHSGESIIKALEQACPRRVLVISDYGAHVSEDIGMPTVFHEFETQFRQLGGDKIILRSAEHMHNWSRSIPPALGSGVMPSFQDPVEMTQPTIAAQDLGRISAELLQRPTMNGALQIVHAEGPSRYSAADVAATLTQLSGRAIRAQAVPRAAWQQVLEQRMPASLVSLLIKANDAKNKGGLVEAEPNVGEVIRGTTELIDALRPFVS